MNANERTRIYTHGNSPGTPAEKKNCTISTTLEKSLMFVIAILAAVMTGLGISIYRLKEDAKSVCYSPSCVFEASNLLRSMNLSADPCDDFYSFVCGGWIARAHPENDLESQFTRLTKNILLRLKEILEDPREESASQHVRKTKKFYDACMDKNHRNRIGVKDLLTDLKDLGGWPLVTENWDPADFDWSTLMVKLFEKGFVHNMLFGVHVAIDSKNTSRTLIQIDQPSLGLSKRIYYTLALNNTISPYKKAICNLANLLQEGLDIEKCLEDVEKAFEIENGIAKILKTVDLKDIDEIYNIKTLAEMEDFAPQIPWRKLLRSLLAPNTSLADEDRIQLTNPSMIKGLNKFFEEMNDEKKTSLANYMLYRAVLHAAHFLSPDISQIATSFIQQDQAVTPQMWEECVKLSMTAFPHSLTSSYGKRYLDNRTKKLLDAMVEDLRAALADAIQHAKWLDMETKNYALYKVKVMKKALAYPEDIKDDHQLDRYYSTINITENHFRNVKEVGLFNSKRRLEGLHKPQKRLLWSDLSNLLTANAYYYPGKNAIIVPVGVLQDTIFAKDRPDYINYGSLGMVVGHELTHAFDSIGSLYNAEGSFQMWWSNSSWSKFLERRNCYEEQYKNYYMKDAGLYVNGTLTLAENLADNGGLLTAYKAYTKLLNRREEKFLPGLPYTLKQMFWISFASVWCRKQSAESIGYTMKHSVHTHSKYRVIGSLANIKEFFEDFKCERKAKDSFKRCSLWD